MMLAHATFPWVKNSVITTSFKDFTGLRYIFGYMEQLEALRSEFPGNTLWSASNQISSVFLGIPINVVHYVNRYKLTHRQLVVGLLLVGNIQYPIMTTFLCWCTTGLKVLVLWTEDEVAEYKPSIESNLFIRQRLVLCGHFAVCTYLLA